MRANTRASESSVTHPGLYRGNRGRVSNAAEENGIVMETPGERARLRRALKEVTGWLTCVVYSDQFPLLQSPRGSLGLMPSRDEIEGAIGRAHVAMSETRDL